MPNMKDKYMAKKKLTPEEMRAIMMPESSEVPVKNEAPLERVPFWEKAAEAASKQHAGEALPSADVSSTTEDVLAAQDGAELTISGPKNSRISETPLIRVVSNFVGQTYTLNVEPRHPKRPWKYEPSVIAMAIASFLDEVIPKSLEVVVRPPKEDWEIMMYTFTVKNLLSQWNVPLELLPSIEQRIAHELQAYC
jgi:hypothetical protein